MPAWSLFQSPAAVLAADRLSDVCPVLREVERAAQRGRWCAGYVAYEAAPAFDPALQTHAPLALPLAWFAIFEDIRAGELPNAPAPPLLPVPFLDEASFARRVAVIKDAIARGETYQVNFTFPLTAEDEAPAEARFARMIRAQQCAYGALIETPEWSLCSASPELFFAREGTTIRCKPMKGTARRGRWPEEDESHRSRLATSEKDRAENVMIVDMVRNDLGRIARIGSVRVESLFDVERLPTVWQMTSTVTAQTDAGLDSVFSALFPCASVTGAPKVQTMRIIRDVESGPRGVYTGAIGFVGPGGNARFNVAIRTLVRLHGRYARYDVGSGIVWDSDPRREYAECLAKARVLSEDPDFRLFTSLRWDPREGAALLDRHIERLRRSAEHFGRPFDSARARLRFEEAARVFPAEPRRVRVELSADGEIAITHAPLPFSVPQRIALAREPIDVDTPFVFHKTSRREHYDRFLAMHPGADDVLLWNERGEITETAIANVAFFRSGQWVTPPVACGLLAGVMRAELLARGDWVEGRILKSDVRAGETIELANAVRGRWRGQLIES